MRNKTIIIKTAVLVLTFQLLGFITHAQTKQPYYYQTVSNADKTLDFAFGFYPGTINYFESKDFPPYTAVRCAVFNLAKETELKWNCQVNILLKSGNLIRNYTPNSKEGPYACTYSVSADSTHYQFFCFHSKFTSNDIDKIWLAMSDDEIFKLEYEKNE